MSRVDSRWLGELDAGLVIRLCRNGALFPVCWGGGFVHRAEVKVSDIQLEEGVWSAGGWQHGEGAEARRGAGPSLPGARSNSGGGSGTLARGPGVQVGVARRSYVTCPLAQHAHRRVTDAGHS